MGEADLSALCQACGLCCDGSLFGRVDLEPAEVDRARRRRLRVIASGKSFEQPCSALAEAPEGPGGRRSCTFYEERPLSCRRFVCRLHEELRRETESFEGALAVVRRARSLLASLDAAQAAQTSELSRLVEERFARA
jgi:Fe-S-cluster containining protein